MNLADKWSIGTLVGLPIALLFLLLLTAAFVFFLVKWTIYKKSEHKGYHDCFESMGFPTLISGVLIVGLVIGTLAFMYPFGSDYHKYKTTTGVVKTVNSRLIASGGSGGGSNTKFVVEYTDGRFRGCEDTRCAAIKPGDKLILECKRQFQWTGEHGYDCNFTRLEHANG